MKREFVNVELKVRDGEEYVWLPERNMKVEPQVLTAYVRQGVRSGDISGGLEVSSDKFTKYTFKAKDNNNGEEYYFVVKIKNEIIKQGSPTANIIKSLSKRSVRKTRQNTTRIAAGIAAGFVLVTSAYYGMASGLKKLKDSAETYSDYVAIAQTYDFDNIPEEAYNEYYNYLKEKADEGDKEAIEEYSIYLMEQQLEEQRDTEEKERGLIR